MKCDHCGTDRPFQAELFRDGEHYYLCHPDVGRDCYHEVTVYGHGVGVLGDGPSDEDLLFLAVMRMGLDSGVRHDLDDVISEFGGEEGV